MKSKVKWAYPEGNEIRRVALENGVETRLTDCHPVRVQHPTFGPTWVRADALREGGSGPRPGFGYRGLANLIPGFGPCREVR